MNHRLRFVLTFLLCIVLTFCSTLTFAEDSADAVMQEIISTESVESAEESFDDLSVDFTAEESSEESDDFSVTIPVEESSNSPKDTSEIDESQADTENPEAGYAQIQQNTAVYDSPAFDAKRFVCIESGVVYIIRRTQSESHRVEIAFCAKEGTEIVTGWVDAEDVRLLDTTSEVPDYLKSCSEKDLAYMGLYPLTAVSCTFDAEDSSPEDEEIPSFVQAYAISYVLNGGTNSPENPDSYTSHDAFDFSDPVRTGYTFAGWYTTSRFKTRINGISTGLTGDKTIYAKWIVNQYRIVFDGNGASNVKPYGQSCTYDKSYRLTGCKYKYTDYTFTGWNTAPDGSGTAYTDKASVKNLIGENAATLTLYAQWKLKTYTITYKLNGGTVEEENATTYTIVDSFDFANPVRTGHVFEGWYTTSGFKVRITGITAGTTGNKTVYAKWTPKKYRIVFDGNGASNVSPYELNCTYDKAYRLTGCKYKYAGYTFTGWNTSPDGSGIAYADKASVKNLTDENAATLTFYAQWKLITYTITYKLNGGTAAPENPSTYTIIDSFDFSDPVRIGYNCDGWYTTSRFKTRITGITAGMTGNITVYAKWLPNTYTFVFNGNGASEESAYTQTVTYSSSAALTANRFTRYAYTLIGWNTEADGSGTAFADKQSLKDFPGENGAVIELYAQWKPNIKTIEYNGVSFNVVNAGVDVVEFSKLTDEQNCQTVSPRYHGKCLKFCYYHCGSIYKGITDLSISDASRGKTYGYSFKTVQSADLRTILNQLYDCLNNGKPQILMVKATDPTSRHFVTVVGYKSEVTEKTALEPTDLLILDSHDGKLESMDPEIFSDNTRVIHTQKGKYRFEAFY